MTEQRGGKREGAGRPKGALDQRTKDRNKVKKEYAERIAMNADMLFNAQFRLATGVQHLFCVHTDSKGNKRPAELITDLATIKSFIDGELDDSADDYYFIATQKPDNKAISDMLNRSFGKPQDKIDVEINDRRKLPPKIMSSIKPRGKAKAAAKPVVAKKTAKKKK